ncbi:MAG TPA: hypothetical protein VE954_09820 [Oligoflexus sp.]|uniref:hypothetical protein n=1 Tax=Oligoflexus sp. TaxID=1971216 RepID=UPI002D67C0D5|nr:hypothetical protein [Oligoflexus sp.]HYX33399.1 hypothetical protein [Oligoflexus sp.]
MSLAVAVSGESQFTAGHGSASIMAKPLIIGTSISADLTTGSPGKRLALRYTKDRNIKIKAESGQSGFRTLSEIRERDYAGRSVVIGLDLFFWDSLLPNIRPSLKALSQLLKKTEELDLPLILGDIPELIPGFQPGREALNREIHRICAASSHCKLIPLDRMYQNISKDGQLCIKGKAYTLQELIPDGLHVSSVAGDYLADVLLGVLEPHSKLAS